MTMLENLVRTLDKQLSDGEHPDGVWRIEGTFDLREVAREVLLAIREPDDGMLLSAGCLTDADAYKAYTAMIDAILAGEG